ncbi:MFS transporter [Thermodesulfobacteriota bacterium]
MKRSIPLIDAVQGYFILIKETRSILVICSATTISMLGQGIIGPVLPLFTRAFGVGTTAIGLVVATFGVSRVIINLPSGFIAERYGSRRLMAAGLMLNAIGLFFTGASHNILEMAVWRFISGGGSAMYVTGAMSFLAETSPPEKRGRLMSLYLGSLLLGTDIGPMIGGFVADHLDFRWPFYLAGALSLTAAVGVLLRLREVTPHGNESSKHETSRNTGTQTKKRYIQSIRELLANPTFLILSLFTMLVFFTRSGSRQTLMPLLAVDKIGLSLTHLGFLFTLMTTINLIFVILAGALSDRFGRKAVLLPGALFSLAGLSLFAWAETVPGFFWAAVLLGLGTGLIGSTPAAYAADLSSPGKAGTTMGLYRTFSDFGLIAGPVLLGWISETLDQGSGSTWGISVSMELNAVLLSIMALLLLVAGKETAGRRK